MTRLLVSVSWIEESHKPRRREDLHVRGLVTRASGQPWRLTRRGTTGTLQPRVKYSETRKNDGFNASYVRIEPFFCGIDTEKG